AIEDEELKFVFGGGFHAQAQCRAVGVEAGADVLDIEDEGVKVGALLGRGFADFSVEALDFQAGDGIDAVGDFFVVNAEKAVLGGENGEKFHVGRGGEDVDGASA